MKLHFVDPPNEDWVGLALSFKGIFLCSAGVSFEHWEVKNRDRLFYVGPSTSEERYLIVLGWFILAFPIVPLYLID